MSNMHDESQKMRDRVYYQGGISCHVCRLLLMRFLLLTGHCEVVGWVLWFCGFLFEEECSSNVSLAEEAY
jgi:hypothetical protein